MKDLKQLWNERKQQLKTLALVATTGAVTYTLAIRRTKADCRIVWFSIDEGESPTGQRLYVRHQDGEEGSYAILN